MTDGSPAPPVTRLPVKVVPGSSRNHIAGWLEASLKVRVRAPPERGKANAAVEKLVACALDLPSGRVRVVSGMTSTRKTLEIAGLSLDEIRARIARTTGPAE